MSIWLMGIKPGLSWGAAKQEETRLSLDPAHRQIPSFVSIPV